MDEEINKRVTHYIIYYQNINGLIERNEYKKLISKIYKTVHLLSLLYG